MSHNCNGIKHIGNNCVQNGITHPSMEPLTTIACIGAGYVGGPTCAVVAIKCPHLTIHVVDKDESRIKAWNSDDLPCYEQGLSDIIKVCRGKNLFFSTDIKEVVEKSQLIFISVNTPIKKTGFGQGQAPDMQYIDACARLIAKYSQSPKIVVEKSTVPVNAAELISKILNNSTDDPNTRSYPHIVLSNPEFLAEGTAVEDLLDPDRILIGGPESPQGHTAVECLAGVYRHWVPSKKIITMNTWSAELSKLVANAVLAQRISSINSISAICEASGANIDQVSTAVGMDKRIGQHFLQASLGFGGSCLEKDVLCLVYLSECLKLPVVAEYWMQVVKINSWQKKRFAEMIVTSMFNSVVGKQICILGYAFKKNTADTRSSAASDVCSYLIEEGAKLSIYDPRAPQQSILYSVLKHSNLEDNSVSSAVSIHTNAYEAASGTHALIICTEWDEFKTLDYKKIYNSMAKPAFVFDGRLIVDVELLRSIGYSVHGIGRC